MINQTKMGASSSILGQEYIYISYSENDKIGDLIRNELLKTDVFDNVIGPIDMKLKRKISIMQNEMSVAQNIIICISRETTSSYTQAQEIHEAENLTTKVIYIMTDATYTPLNNSGLNSFILNKKWLPAYDFETIRMTLTELISLSVFKK